jgi:hypothetical protein
MKHGRYLTGFGDDAPSVSPEGGDPTYDTDDLDAMEQDDDVLGSGIFDAHARITSNREMGIFSSDYSLPGYIAREVPYAVSQDVTGMDGGGVVYIPAGGFYHIESGGRVVPAPVLGPTRRPPRNVPAPHTDNATPYVNIQPDYAARDDLNALSPVMPAPTYKPARTYPGSIEPMAPSPNMQRLPVVYETHAPLPAVPITSVGSYHIRPVRRGASGLGDSSTSSTVGIVIGAAVVGGVIGLVAASLSGPKAARARVR